MFVNLGGVKFTLCIFARYLLKNVIQKNSKMKKNFSFSCALFQLCFCLLSGCHHHP
jgi:hypothetical protein